MEKQETEPSDEEPLMGFFEHPFAQINSEQIPEFRKALVAEHSAKFDIYLQKVDNLILQTNPLALMAMASHFTLSRPMDDLEQTFSDEEYVHFASELELLQAFVLRKEVSEFQPEFVHPDTVTEVLDTIKKLSSANSIRRLGQLDLEDSEGDHHSKMIVEQFRIDTQNVRNAGYLQQMTRVYCDLLQPLDEIFEQKSA